jgi:hypothetical protein
MSDRNQTHEQSSSKSAPKSAQGEQPDAGRDDGIGQNPDPNSEKSTASRPHGHTEEPDRTL